MNYLDSWGTDSVCCPNDEDPRKIVTVLPKLDVHSKKLGTIGTIATLDQ